MLQIEKSNGVSKITNYSFIECFKIVEYLLSGLTGEQKAIRMTENVDNTDVTDKSNKQLYLQLSYIFKTVRVSRRYLLKRIIFITHKYALYKNRLF